MTAKVAARRKPGPPSNEEKAAAGYDWAVRLVGEFERPGKSAHLLVCATRDLAEGRAAFWRRWRRDVQVSVCVRDGRGWRQVAP